MFERIKRLYDDGKLTKQAVRNAVFNNLITKADYYTITGEEYD